MYSERHDRYDDLDVMSSYDELLDDGEINDYEEGFIRGFVAAA